MTEPDGRSFEVGRRRRPRWMTFFTVLMFLFGANVFVDSIDDLYRLATAKAKVIHNLEDLGNPQNEAILRAQSVLDNELFVNRPKVMAVQRGVRLLLGLVYLFAVAAVVTRDPRGRRACVLANWLGLAWSMANAVFLLLWVRPALPWVLPKLVQALGEDATRMGRPVPTAEVVAEQSRLFLIYGPVTLCGVGMVLSLLLLAYFAGRRMRWFYEQLGQAHG